MHVYGVDAAEAGSTRFNLIGGKGKAYIMIFRHVEEEADALRIDLQRGLLIQPENLDDVIKNFEAAARRGLHKPSALEASSTAPTTFAALA